MVSKDPSSQTRAGSVGKKGFGDQAESSTGIEMIPSSKSTALRAA